RAAPDLLRRRLRRPRLRDRGLGDRAGARRARAAHVYPAQARRGRADDPRRTDTRRGFAPAGGDSSDARRVGSGVMQRYDYLKTIAPDVGDALVVAAGWASREWQALRPSDANFRPRTLGLASSISLGIALGLPNRKVIAIDGDGAFLMNLCG